MYWTGLWKEKMLFGEPTPPTSQSHIFFYSATTLIPTTCPVLSKNSLVFGVRRLNISDADAFLMRTVLYLQRLVVSRVLQDNSSKQNMSEWQSCKSAVISVRGAEVVVVILIIKNTMEIVAQYSDSYDSKTAFSPLMLLNTIDTYCRCIYFV